VAHASFAEVWSTTVSQSKKILVWVPKAKPASCGVWHDDPQQAVPAHSQPSSGAGVCGVLQLE
jgi:hypothetical protein